MGGHLINYAFKGKFLYESVVSILNVCNFEFYSFKHFIYLKLREKRQVILQKSNEQLKQEITEKKYKVFPIFSETSIFSNVIFMCTKLKVKPHETAYY